MALFAPSKYYFSRSSVVKLTHALGTLFKIPFSFHSILPLGTLMTFVKLGRPFLRSSLLLSVFLLSPQLSYGLQTTAAESVRIQAEDFTDLGNFFTENFSAEGGEVIRLGFNGDTGTCLLYTSPSPRD